LERERPVAGKVKLVGFYVNELNKSDATWKAKTTTFQTGGKYLAHSSRDYETRRCFS
jgi:hypothetical protein